jgi:hypothetical protein
VLGEEAAARFWSNVDRLGPDDCWRWLGTTDVRGRGQVYLGRVNGRLIRASATRMAWELMNGAIPDGQKLCHTCDNVRCCNAQRHLFLGSQLQNLRDCSFKHRRNAFGQQKLQVADVRELRALAAAGTPRKAIAQRFGIAPHTVTLIVHRHSWAWLDAPEVILHTAELVHSTAFESVSE